MLRRFLPILAAAVSLLLAGCFAVSKNPLSTPGTSMIDRRIEGVFADRRDKPGEGLSVSYFRYRREPSKAGHPERITPWLEMAGMEQGSNGGLQSTTYRALTTRLGGHDYISIAMPFDAGKGPAYFLIRYEFGLFGDLRLWTADTHVLRKAVRSGKLRGRVMHEKTVLGIEIDTVTITDSTEHLAAFVAGSDPKVLFGGNPQIFHRIAREWD